MSTNFHIYGVREIVVVKTGKTEKQYISFKTLQTPTKKTWIMMNAKNPIETYSKWVKEHKDPWVVEFHLIDLKEWLNGAKNDGYEVRWEAW